MPPPQRVADAVPFASSFPELDPGFSVARLLGTALKRFESEAPAMLPPFIIDQIRRREEEERRKQELEQPRLELPDDVYRPAREQPDDAPQRGVIILEL
jgi:hypothetical protein